MFTGIVQTTGRLTSAKTRGGQRRIRVRVPNSWAAGLKRGESVSVNGICLTATAYRRPVVAFDVVGQTLRMTTADLWQPGTRLNLERALRWGDRMGGHCVSGHVEAVGKVRHLIRKGRDLMLVIQAPARWVRRLRSQGSVVLDGVSLTVSKRHGKEFCVALVPYTLASTTLARLRPGSRVNLEAE